MDHFPVVGVQGCLQGNQSREPPGHLRHVTDFVGRQAAAQEGLFAVGQPLLDDLVAANGVVPHRLGYVPPARDIVKVDVVCPVIPSDEFPFARHCDATLAGVTPSGGQVQVADFGLRRFPVHALKDGNTPQFVSNLTSGYAGNRRFRVQQGRHLPPKRRRGEQRILRLRKRNPRPVLTDAVRVLGEIGGRVTNGQRVIPDQFGGCLIGVRVGQAERRQIGAGA